MKRMKVLQSRRVFAPGVLMLLLLVGSRVAQADITYTGSSGTLAASAVFNLTGNTLTITLANTSASDVLVPTDVLTGLFFDTSHTLTPVSASLNGSTVYYGSIVNNVGEGWQYMGGISAHSENAGLSTAGLGIFGPNGNFYSPGVKVAGLDYGILSAGDNSATGNGGVTGQGPLIKNSIQFTLTAGSGFSLAEIGNSVVFQYGTALSDASFNGNLQGVPEPSSILSLIVMLGAVGTGVLLKHKRLS